MTYKPTRELERISEEATKECSLAEYPDGIYRVDSGNLLAFTHAVSHRLLPALQNKVDGLEMATAAWQNKYTELRTEKDALRHVMGAPQAEDENLKRNANNLLQRNATLQAENERLRADLKLANEWRAAGTDTAEGFYEETKELQARVKGLEDALTDMMPLAEIGANQNWIEHDIRERRQARVLAAWQALRADEQKGSL